MRKRFHRLAVVESAHVGDETRVWAFAHVMKGARVGARCNLGEGVFVESGVVIAGNNKDAPEEIPRLLDPIINGADFVQGSRFLAGGRAGGMPLYRHVATRLHPLLFSLTSGKRVSESTNGFRAFRAALLDDPRINLHQSWLDEYELEPYLYWKAIRLGYRTAEVPVTKIYPPRAIGYTKMKPITGWWSMLRPLVLLGLRLRS